LAEHHVPPARIVVIPEAIDTTVFEPAAVSRERMDRLKQSWRIDQGDGRQIILVAARLTGWKGHRVIIKALAGCGAARARLVFAGRVEDNAYASELAAEAESVGVDLTIAGPCADMPAAYLAADLVAAPSTLPESFGRSVAEAGAMERVVIASRLGGTAETIVDAVTGWQANPGDVAAWAATLDLALAMGPEERTKMGAAARARICDLYSLERMCEATFDLYRRMCEARS
jgi:glycosyltransferase involved in cell wall biosynthesis